MLRHLSRPWSWAAGVVAALIAVAVVAIGLRADDDPALPATSVDAKAAGCGNGMRLSAEQRQNCELTGSIDPHPVLDVRLREPIVRGMTLAEAEKALRGGDEVTWIRAHEHAMPVPEWVVCYQAEPILRDGDHARFETRLVLAPECPPPDPRIADGERLGRAQGRLDAVGIKHVLVDAADEDFPRAPRGNVGARWIVCGPVNVRHEIAGWLTGEGNGGYEYESGDKLIVALPVAPDRPGCSRANEEEEQGEGAVRVPNVLGANYYTAIELADSVGVELDHPSDPNLSSDWIVCDQDPPAGRRLSRAVFATLRVRLAPSC